MSKKESGKLSTEGISEQGSTGTNKMISIGNHEAYIREVSLSQHTEFAKKKNAYHVVLLLETDPPSGDFEGFFIDSKEESKGRYTGQIARVKTTNWPYADGENTRGVKFNRDMDIMKMIKTICGQLGKPEWFDAQNNKHDTIEQFVTAFNTEAPFKDIKLNFCIAGREYPKENGYMATDLFLPRYKDGIAIEALNVDKSKLLKFDASNKDHFEKYETAEVEGFAGDNATPNDVNKDFTL